MNNCLSCGVLSEEDPCRQCVTESETKTFQATIAELESENMILKEDVAALEEGKEGCLRIAEKRFNENKVMREALEEIQKLVNEQAEDEGLFFVAETVTEDYLMRGLRLLHSAIEQATKALLNT